MNQRTWLAVSDKKRSSDRQRLEQFTYEPDQPIRGDLSEYAYHQRGWEKKNAF